jgi:hypothetical protein
MTATIPTKGAALAVGQTIAVGVGHVSHRTITALTFQVPPRPRGIDSRPLDKDNIERLSHLTHCATVTDERGRTYTMPIHRVREYQVIAAAAPVSDECAAGRCANCWDDACGCDQCGHPGA